MKILTVIILVLFKTFFATSAVAAGASAYIADSGYLKYRMELLQEALNNPMIAERIENAQSIEEENEVLKAELEEKLKRYRDENGLDENGAIRK